MWQVALLWAQAGSRFTHLFEAQAINVLLASNVKKAAAQLLESEPLLISDANDKNYFW